VVHFSAGGDGAKKPPELSRVRKPQLVFSGRMVDEGIVEFRVHGAQHETVL
jgi:hypothetical protein